MKTIEYINKIENKINIKNNISAIARVLGVSRQAVQQYKKGQSSIDSDVILKVSEILNIPEAIILIDVKAEKAKSNEAKFKWIKTKKHTEHLLNLGKEVELMNGTFTL